MPFKLYIYDVMTDKARDPLAVCLKGGFLACSWVYGLLVRIVRCSYLKGIAKRYSLDKPVISVGNITVGGVGKTPLVEYIATLLKLKGLKPVILIRGYMEKRIHYASPQDGPSDEAMELRRSLPDVPVMVGPDRLKSAQAVPLGYGADVYILDDAYQHWKLARDMDIVAIDALNPFGNRHMIPRGILREPLNGLSRADMFVITKSDLGAANVTQIENDILRHKPGALIVTAVHQPQKMLHIRSGRETALKELAGERVCCFSSIGNPQSFAQTLTNIGCRLECHFPFVDHHIYQKKDFRRIIECCRENNIKTVITTQKDAVKLDDFLSVFPQELELYSLKINMKITHNAEQFQNSLTGLC